MLPSDQGMNLIQGKYVNTEFGFEITFPDAVQGVNTTLPGYTTVNVNIPTPPSLTNMMIILTDSSKEDSSTQTFDAGYSDFCKPLSSENVNLGGKKAQASITPCNMLAFTSAKTRNYDVDLGEGKAVSIIFVSNPSLYDAGLPKFEEIVKTVKFTE
jgi:hypothetical protein